MITTNIKSSTPIRFSKLEELPDWMKKIVRKQIRFNTKYECAHEKFVDAYNEFLTVIEEINETSGTDFSFQKAMDDFGGNFSMGVIGKDEEYDDED